MKERQSPLPDRVLSDRWVFLPIAVTLLIVGFFLGRATGMQRYLMASNPEQLVKDAGVELYQELFNLIVNNYVMPIDTPEEQSKLVYGAMQGMFMPLSQEPYNDPYSGFLPPQQFKEFRTRTKGNYTGIGVMITVDTLTGYPRIVRVFRDSPAEEAGLKRDDLIIKVEGQDMRGVPLELVTEKIKGPEGSRVRLTISRVGESEDLELSVERRRVVYHAVEEKRLLDDGVGYIKLSTFNTHAAEEVKEALEELTQQGMDSLILDLRGNGGGLLEEAVKICSLFLPSDKTVVTVEYRNRPPDFHYADQYPEDEKYLDLPIVVLINRESASASEIVAAALRDNGRAVLVGDRTYGKGTVQESFQLEGENMGAILTVARYVTPSGEYIHGEGVYPDVPYTFLDYLNDDPKLERLYQQLNELRRKLIRTQRELSGELEQNDLGVKRADEILTLIKEGLPLPEVDAKKAIEEAERELEESYYAPAP